MTMHNNDNTSASNYQGSAYDFDRDKKFNREEADRRVIEGQGGEQVRADEEIVKEISEQLTMQGLAESKHLAITVKEGTVYLKGQVRNENEKNLVKDTVSKISGVRGIDDHLAIKP